MLLRSALLVELSKGGHRAVHRLRTILRTGFHTGMRIERRSRREARVRRSHDRSVRSMHATAAILVPIRRRRRLEPGPDRPDERQDRPGEQRRRRRLGRSGGGGGGDHTHPRRPSPPRRVPRLRRIGHGRPDRRRGEGILLRAPSIRRSHHRAARDGPFGAEGRRRAPGRVLHGSHPRRGVRDGRERQEVIGRTSPKIHREE
mmetsp:Transcript_41005/g.123748  ORF Transcript_41005/g.123748 Transcript_41005/m.123748 type:complete len:202 (+) Transcript_41005:1006-1611(+)